MPVSKEVLAGRLRAAREACQMKQEDAANHLGVSRSTIVQMELGNRAVTSLELDGLAFLYGRDIREFVADEFRSEDVLLALFRRHPEVSEHSELQAVLQQAMALGREITSLERLLGVERDPSALPVYQHQPPQTKWEAVQQGERIAGEERRRIGLGNSPLQNVAEVLDGQGVRTAQLGLPEDVSGLTLFDLEAGAFVVVNNALPSHSRVRRRFSCAHEYCHVLLDRDQKGTISRASERHSLMEVRANAFAAGFLMPRTGIEEFLARMGKGWVIRQAEVYDEGEPQRVQVRPGSQAIQMHDLVLLAHYLGVSRIAALYRLKNLRFLTEPELERLKEQEDTGMGKALQDLLDLPEFDDEDARNESSRRFVALALDALRREEITRAKFEELARMVNIATERLDNLLAQVAPRHHE